MPQRFSSGVARNADAAVDRTPTVPTDLTFTSAPVGSRWFALEDTAGVTTSDAVTSELVDIASSCGLRVLVSRGGITFAAASAESDVHTLRVCLDPRGERSCAFADAVHKMEEHALHDFPILGPRTTHWLVLEIDTTGGSKQWGFHHRILELTSNSSCARCLVTTRSSTNSIFADLALGEVCHDGFSCGKNALLRSNVRPRLAVSMRDMPRSDVSFRTDLDQREARWSPKSSKNGLPHNLRKRVPSFGTDVKDVKKRELVAAASDLGGRNHRKPK